MLKKIVAGLLGILPLAVQAEDCCLPSYEPGTPLCEDEVCTMYPAFAGIKLQCGLNAFGYLDFLYWSPVTSRNYVATTFEGTPTGSVQRELFHRLDYRPGFKIGLGMVLPDADDNWIMSFEYLWYHHDFTKTFSALPATVANTFDQLTDPIYRSIKSRFHINYDVLTSKIGRPNYLGQHMIFSPYLAIKWLRRSNKTAQYLTNATTGVVDHLHARLSYTCLGGGVGMGTEWLLCWGLRFIGKIEFNTLVPYSRKNIEIVEPAIGPSTSFKNRNRHLDALVISGIGIGWGKYFCCNRYHADLTASWDLFGDSSDLDFNVGMFSKGTVIINGLTVSGRFDF